MSIRRSTQQMSSLAITQLALKLKDFIRSHWEHPSVLPYIPKPLKWLALFLLLINAKGFPLGWHRA